MLQSMSTLIQDHAREVKKYGNETDVSNLTGRAVKSLQKDRLHRKGLPYYRFGRKILYDLAEVEQIIRSSRVEVGR